MGGGELQVIPCRAADEVDVGEIADPIHDQLLLLAQPINENNTHVSARVHLRHRHPEVALKCVERSIAVACQIVEHLNPGRFDCLAVERHCNN